MYWNGKHHYTMRGLSNFTKSFTKIPPLFLTLTYGTASCTTAVVSLTESLSLRHRKAQVEPVTTFIKHFSGAQGSAVQVGGQVEYCYGEDLHRKLKSFPMFNL